jgi:hypothetical protein
MSRNTIVLLIYHCEKLLDLVNEGLGLVDYSHHPRFSIMTTYNIDGCSTSLTASVVLWSEFLATDPEVRVRFLALPDFLRSSGSGTGSTQSREYNLAATRKK